ncbi:hypothetical protein VIGAN_08266300 [Vigna angularis var. angularis]|uniref:Uncharacterized protein n=1 Tax=Vigna angularis var. angularis TaxID=157739 RepID=A0A0S3SSS2_PHAAN|nr:hypothetical protein VIGAN_08266300 [Vigna angularis var. angularis]
MCFHYSSHCNSVKTCLSLGKLSSQENIQSKSLPQDVTVQLFKCRSSSVRGAPFCDSTSRSNQGGGCTSSRPRHLLPAHTVLHSQAKCFILSITLHLCGCVYAGCWTTLLSTPLHP